MAIKHIQMRGLHKTQMWRHIVTLSMMHTKHSTFPYWQSFFTTNIYTIDNNTYILWNKGGCKAVEW